MSMEETIKKFESGEDATKEMYYQLGSTVYNTELKKTLTPQEILDLQVRLFLASLQVPREDEELLHHVWKTLGILHERRRRPSKVVHAILDQVNDPKVKLWVQIKLARPDTVEDNVHHLTQELEGEGEGLVETCLGLYSDHPVNYGLYADSHLDPQTRIDNMLGRLKDPDNPKQQRSEDVQHEQLTHALETSRMLHALETKTPAPSPRPERAPTLEAKPSTPTEEDGAGPGGWLRRKMRRTR